MAVIDELRKRRPDEEKEIERLRKQLEIAKRETERARQQNNQYQQIIEAQQDQLKARAKQIFASPQKATGKGKSWHRVIIPDTHGSQIDKKAAKAFLHDLSILRPKQIVLAGDHLECGGFLAQHHTLGFVAQADYTYTEDIAETNCFLDAVDRESPDSEKHYLEGNHEGRVETWCMTQALKNGIDAQLLLDALGPQKVLNLGTRGYHFYRRSETYCGLKIRGTIRLGECHFTHGTVTAKRAAGAMLGRYAANIIFGHTHRIDSVVEKLLDRIVISASVGCLSQLQPLWRHSDPTTWSHGYGVQICRPNGEFLHVTIPIIDGQSLLGPLLGKI